MTASRNWIHNTNKTEPSLNDMLKHLLKMGRKLVLVQFHELERLKLLKSREPHNTYIERLYNHYIVKGLPKQYLIDNNVG